MIPSTTDSANPYVNRFNAVVWSPSPALNFTPQDRPTLEQVTYIHSRSWLTWELVDVKGPPSCLRLWHHLSNTNLVIHSVHWKYQFHKKIWCHVSNVIKTSVKSHWVANYYNLVIQSLDWNYFWLNLMYSKTLRCTFFGTKKKSV